MTLGTFGVGSPPHLTILALNKQYGLNIEPIHYRGEAPMFTDMLAQTVDGGIGTIVGAQPVLQSGAGAVVAVPRKRLTTFPEVRDVCRAGGGSAAVRSADLSMLRGAHRYANGHCRTPVGSHHAGGADRKGQDDVRRRSESMKDRCRCRRRASSMRGKRRVWIDLAAGNRRSENLASDPAPSHRRAASRQLSTCAATIWRLTSSLKELTLITKITGPIIAIE